MQRPSLSVCVCVCACDLVSMVEYCQISMKFSVGILCKKLSSKRDIYETWSSDGHSLTRSIIEFVPVIYIFLD